MRKNGHAITPDHLCFFTDAFVGDSKEAALTEYSPYYFYFVHTLWHHGSTKEKEAAVKSLGLCQQHVVRLRARRRIAPAPASTARR